MQARRRPPHRIAEDPDVGRAFARPQNVEPPPAGLRAGRHHRWHRAQEAAAAVQHAHQLRQGADVGLLQQAADLRADGGERPVPLRRDVGQGAAVAEGLRRQVRRMAMWQQTDDEEQRPRRPVRPHRSRHRRQGRPPFAPVPTGAARNLRLIAGALVRDPGDQPAQGVVAVQPEGRILHPRRVGQDAGLPRAVVAGPRTRVGPCRKGRGGDALQQAADRAP
ncbi:MAG: hypothetical protein AAFU61_07180 [Pseudomonadota bacterium]